MLRFIARFLGLWLLAGALVALVVDGARTIAASQMVMTSLGALWRQASPESLEAAREAVGSTSAPWLWDSVIVWVLLAPTFAMLAALGAFLLFLGQKRRPEMPELDTR